MREGKYMDGVESLYNDYVEFKKNLEHELEIYSLILFFKSLGVGPDDGTVIELINYLVMEETD